MLPHEALEIIFSHSGTCLSEYELFSAITERMKEVDCPKEQQFLKDMLKHVRLPLIKMRQLVTDIKFSGHFDDSLIFEALQFQVA
jgi:hypothetical protein